MSGKAPFLLEGGAGIPRDRGKWLGVSTEGTGSVSCLAAKGRECGNVASSFPSPEEKQRKQILINMCTNTVFCPPSGTGGHLSEVIYN